jgi:hypothetical protein
LVLFIAHALLAFPPFVDCLTSEFDYGFRLVQEIYPANIALAWSRTINGANNRVELWFNTWVIPIILQEPELDLRAAWARSSPFDAGGSAVGSGEGAPFVNERNRDYFENVRLFELNVYTPRLFEWSK